MDPFDNFDQQERSWSHLEEHSPRLAREAAAILDRDPILELAGLILETGTPESARYRTDIEQTTGQEFTPPVLAGAVPRRKMLEIAGKQRAAWVEQNAPPFARFLPVLAAMKNGRRFGILAIPETAGGAP